MSKYLNKALFMREDPKRGVSAPNGSTKARIERASLRLFAEHGIDGVSIKDIAKACELSDGAMYRHFESKDALARQLFEAIHKRLMGLVKDTLEDGATLEDTVRAVTAAFCELAETEPSQFAYHLTQRNVFLARSGDGGADPSSLLARRIAAAMAAGEIPQDDPELKSAMAMGVVMQAGEYRLFGRIRSPLTSHTGSFVRAIMAVLKTV